MPSKRQTLERKTSNIEQIIQDAARKHGIDPNILRAVGEQETGLGTSSVYDPATGLSRTKGNAGHGIWQLDPASGASKEVLDRAAKDPAFAADYAAGMLANAIKANGGNVQAALASYNAGTPNSHIGQAYAQQVLARIPDFQNRRGSLELASRRVPQQVAAQSHQHRAPARKLSFGELRSHFHQLALERSSPRQTQEDVASQGTPLQPQARPSPQPDQAQQQQTRRASVMPMNLPPLAATMLMLYQLVSKARQGQGAPQQQMPSLGSIPQGTGGTPQAQGYQGLGQGFQGERGPIAAGLSRISQLAQSGAPNAIAQRVGSNQGG